ncbi:putative monovalent cation/H+ antiporter subunit A [Coraliomargarita sp. SDUM461004]|uniref:Monovalent cation/H+ antiporter subunit A n=1 Tax=Thalassobacterium sedimentorum TaxID=3041258 RepID=A0ABU1AIX5_9BACT|nr:putative monovalent cation/H+ antiporter subunit A [Coraliomargarita sp. SDUM461004]MDQ8194584.1 putative monovalent cation/H+ antiporter subunit A [Coraliomargarita sp. SDUM461004]
MPTILILSLAIIFLTACLAPTLVRYLGDRAGWLLAFAPFSAFIMLVAQAGMIEAGEALVYQVDWFSVLDTSFSLRLDGLSLLMALLVTGIGGFIVIYAGGYMHGHPQLGRFYLYLLAFMGAMLGLVVSDDLILVFVFWELTSISSYLLIGFNHEQKETRWKALQALLVTGLGAMAMLVGFILIGTVTGSYSLAEITRMGDLLQGSPWFTAIVILILGGAFTKSAQVPFHFWLPNAMAGPTPVSAYLHSATMVKAGIYLMARLNPSFAGSGLWEYTLAIFGSLTLLLAMFLGLFQKDVKSILAYTTLGVLGVLTMLLGIGSEYAIKAMVVFLIGHALYKATLFMVVGSIDHETGTRDVTLLRGLRKLMPISALAGGLAALSMSGLPPFFGFIGKELIYKAGVKLNGAELIFLVVALVGNLIMMGLALKAGVGPFFGKPNHAVLPKKPHEAPLAMWLGPIVLSVAGLVIGIIPFWVTEFMVAPALAAIRGAEIAHLDLALWNLVRPNLPLLLSGVTVLGGFFVFLNRARFWAVADRVLTTIQPYGAEAMYGRIFNATIWFSKAQTRWLQTGRLHDYVFLIVMTTVGFLTWAIVSFGGLNFSVDWAAYDLLIICLVIIMIIAALVAVTGRSYITVLVALGVVGFGVALIFAYYGAPDLAITQLLVETLTVVLFMFVVLRLPPLKTISGRFTRLRDGIMATAFGGLITILLLKAVNIQFDHAISDQLAAMSYPEAKGKNVVNVILVDFRALDTMGEIVVVTVAALGIAALVKSGLKGKGKRS